MNSKVLMIAATASVVSIFVAGSPALAQETTKSASASYGKNYFRVDAGAIWITDTDFTVGLSAHDVSTTAAGDYSFDMGTAVSGTIGYRFSKKIRAEIEMGYATADFDTINGNMTVTAGGASTTVSSSKSVSGDVTQMGALANVIFDLNEGGKFTPYLGGGLGFYNVNSKISKIGTLTVNGEETDTHLAVAMMLGGDYQLQDKVSVGAKYRYLWIDTEKGGLDSMASHALMATLTFDM